MVDSHDPRPDGSDPEHDFAATVISAPGVLAGLGDAGREDDADSLPDGEAPLGHIGRYALKRMLGEGGLGIVYEAWDPLLSRSVAVKTLQFDVDEPARLALDRLFLNEARAVARLNHPHIVTVFDAGLSPQGVYIAMERLRGRDMRQALAAGWRPSPQAAAQLVRRVADALAYAHARGVVHCDIKPANIFLTRKDRPTVLDFGIARVAHGAAPAADGLVAGSPYYLAPEQLQGGGVDTRTDVYAMGVVLYELLTGRRAFGGDSLEQIHEAVLHHPPPPAHSVEPVVPVGLSALVEKAMARDPAERPASAAEFAQQLRLWHTRPGEEETPPPAAPGWQRPALWGAGAALLLVGLTALAVLRPAEPTFEAAAVAGPAVGEAPRGGRLQPPLPLAEPASAAAPAVAAAEPARPAARVTRPKRSAPAPAPVEAAAAATGSLQLAVTPWGQIEIDGKPAGVTPPLTRIDLPEGRHVVTVRNGDFPPHTVQVQVKAGQPATVRHRFVP